jgi:hypothetical protein
MIIDDYRKYPDDERGVMDKQITDSNYKCHVTANRL